MNEPSGKKNEVGIPQVTSLKNNSKLTVILESNLFTRAVHFMAHPILNCLVISTDITLVSPAYNEPAGNQVTAKKYMK